MARYLHYDPQQTKMIAMSYGRRRLPGAFEHALSYLSDSQIDLERFATRFKNDETGATAYDPAVLLKLVLFAYSRGIAASRTMARGLCGECAVHHLDQRKPERSRQEHQVDGIDGKSLAGIVRPCAY